MKIAFCHLSLWALLMFGISSCSESDNKTSLHLKRSGSKLLLSERNNQKEQEAVFVIYDYQKDQSGLRKIRIVEKSSGKNQETAIITAFLTHNHIIEKNEQVKLLKVEEINGITHYNLQATSDLANQYQLKLFKEALELTLLHHLKHKNFLIVFDH